MKAKIDCILDTYTDRNGNIIVDARLDSGHKVEVMIKSFDELTGATVDINDIGMYELAD